jgi:rubrerythrin
MTDASSPERGDLPPQAQTAAEASDELRRLLGAAEPADVPTDTPPGPPLEAPDGLTRGRAVWRCEHCGWEGEAWVRPQCPHCYTMSTQAIRWVGQ